MKKNKLAQDKIDRLVSSLFSSSPSRGLPFTQPSRPTRTRYKERDRVPVPSGRHAQDVRPEIRRGRGVQEDLRQRERTHQLHDAREVGRGDTNEEGQAEEGAGREIVSFFFPSSVGESGGTKFFPPSRVV